MPSPGRAQLDPDLKIFRDLVQSGITPTEAYRRVYAATRKISDQACYMGGLRKMRRINLLNPDTASLNSTTQPATKPVKKPVMQPATEQDFTSPRKLLLKRLWEAVNSQANPEAIAAVKQLRDWLREDEQAAESKQVSDPAIICKHLSAIKLEYEDMDTAQRLQYAARIVDCLDKLGIPADDLRQVLPAPPISPNRADAPPLLETLDSIDSNTLPQTDTPTISDTIQEKQCPLDANAVL